MRPLLAWYISLDGTFNPHCFMFSPKILMGQTQTSPFTFVENKKYYRDTKKQTCIIKNVNAKLTTWIRNIRAQVQGREIICICCFYLSRLRVHFYIFHIFHISFEICHNRHSLLIYLTNIFPPYTQINIEHFPVFHNRWFLGSNTNWQTKNYYRTWLSDPAKNIGPVKTENDVHITKSRARVFLFSKSIGHFRSKRNELVDFLHIQYTEYISTAPPHRPPPGPP